MSKADETSTLKVIAFPGAPNLPTFAAIAKGFFAAEGLAVDLATTPSSVYQAEKLAAGEFDIAFTAFDNVVAYGEGQGAAKIDGNPDFCVLMGATQIELSFVVAPEIGRYEDLRGRSLALDAPSTGFAFVLYEMLSRNGLAPGDYEVAAVGATPQRWQSVKAGEHAGTISIEPFTSLARGAGFKVLDVSSNLFDAYQGGIVAARRSWALQNADRVKRFLRGYLAGLAWTLAPGNRSEAEALLLQNMPEIKPGAVNAVMNSLLSPRSGLTPNAAVLRDGMATVLALRSRYGRPQKTLTDVDKYLELSLYDEVIGS